MTTVCLREADSTEQNLPQWDLVPSETTWGVLFSDYSDGALLWSEAGHLVYSF